ncbi:ROK family transcriptional regulator [soil metagenome]
MNNAGIPAATDQVRRQNTALILRSLRMNGPSTRADLAKRTGLAKATVGTIIGQLDLAGAVVEDQAQASGRGRPGRPVVLSGERTMGVGLEINVDYMSAVALDLSGRERLVETRPLAAGATPEDLVSFAVALTQRLEDDGHTIVGVTAAVPGLVDRAAGIVSSAPNLHWSQVPLRDLLAARLSPGAVVSIDNDANCAALAEGSRGAAVDSPSALYLTGTVGVGAGILVDGQVLRGGSGFAGEVGHMPIGDPRVACGCGRSGCWEASIGLRAMLTAVGMSESGTPLETARAVADRAKDDASVREGLDSLANWLGNGIAVLSNILNPSIVILGGYFVPIGTYLVPRIREIVDAKVLAAPLQETDICLSSLGIHAAATGAAEEALSVVYAGVI